MRSLGSISNTYSNPEQPPGSTDTRSLCGASRLAAKAEMRAAQEGVRWRGWEEDEEGSREEDVDEVWVTFGAWGEEEGGDEGIAVDEDDTSVTVTCGGGGEEEEEGAEEDSRRGRSAPTL